MLTDVYDDVYDMLVPLSSYIQPHPAWTPVLMRRDGREHGFPTELAIALIPATIILLFFEGFFRELGKEAATKILKEITDRIHERRWQVVKGELEDLEAMIRSEIARLPKQGIDNVEMEEKAKIAECLQEVGLPAPKAERLASEIVQVLDRRVQDLIASQESTRRDT